MRFTADLGCIGEAATSHSPVSGIYFRNSGGYWLGQQKPAILAKDLVPHDFHRFVTQRFGRQYPDVGKGWSSFIEENTKSEQEAFDLFFKLREEFEHEKNTRSK
jgi:hypothetical protein